MLAELEEENGKLPRHNWVINKTSASSLSNSFSVPIVDRLLNIRGIEEREDYLFPDRKKLDSPIRIFPDLRSAVNILESMIVHGHKIAIVGDYDADGMTSTALLLRSLKYLGADVIYAIPSRLGEGYGINLRIVEEFHEEGIGCIITVDNGICAHAPIARAVELGILVIVTDHHELPDVPVEADAILNPKLIDQNNPWSQISGVGMAFVLALQIAAKFGKHKELLNPMTELLTLGTIADMVPLTGVNRRWVKRGLKLLADSQVLGVQALIASAGLDVHKGNFKPDDIGFKLAPRINAVGRIGDPDIVIRLLSTEDPQEAMQLAQDCEDCNYRRQVLTKQAKDIAFAKVKERIEDFEQEQIVEVASHPIYDDKVLIVIDENIHKGIAGLVASALVEKYGVPAFVGTYSKGVDGMDYISGSARGGSNFNVLKALDHVGLGILTSYGGHKVAGGFSLPAYREESFCGKLTEFASHTLSEKDIGKLIMVDLELPFSEITEKNYEQLQMLQPFGMGNYEPTFFTRRVQVVSQEKIGKTPENARFIFESKGKEIKAVGWGMSEYLPLPAFVDIAYKIKLNEWLGKKSVELTLESFREALY